MTSSNTSQHKRITGNLVLNTYAHYIRNHSIKEAVRLTANKLKITKDQVYDKLDAIASRKMGIK